MRTNRFTSWASARVAIASVAVAGVAVLAACSEGGVASSLNSPSLRLGQSTITGIANATIARVCATGPFGTYTFVNSNYTQGASGTTVLNSPVGVPYTIIVNAGNPTQCVDVLTRTSGTSPADAFSTVTATQTSGPAGSSFSTSNCVDDSGDIPSTGCGTNAVTINANLNHGTVVTFVSVVTPCTTNCIGTPQFVVGDLASGLQLAATLKGSNPNTLNFWGSQWWKNNPMTEYKDNGWPSFKGYATTADNFCTAAARWTSRVGNSPPPPATIGEDVIVIVTSNVWKDGPDISGNIKQIIVVHQDGGYGPNPGHDGNGPRIQTLCTQGGV